MMDQLRVATNVIETQQAGKRYGRTWALRECTLAIPRGPGDRAGWAQRSR